MDKKKVLIINGRYLPGYKDGGPVRTIKNIVDFLGDEYDIRILTLDRDHGDSIQYSNIKINTWNSVGNAKVFYVPPKGFSFGIIKELAKEVDLIYVCGCFSDYAIKTIILKRLNLIKKPVVVASMGLFSPLAFKIKYIKKKAFVTIFNFFNMSKNLYWSATSEIEKKEILCYIKVDKNKIFIAKDLPRKIKHERILKNKKEDEIKIVWISRITPKKNLLGVINILKQLKTNIYFSIYGSIHDKEYWKQCEKELKNLPKNIRYKYYGNIESEQVISTLSGHHIFLFLTYGENYGHVIPEALEAGCPCILSNQTPWLDLEKYGAGFVLDLNETKKIIEKIEYYAKMNNEEFQEKSDAAYNYAVSNNSIIENLQEYRKVFNIH